MLVALRRCCVLAATPALGDGRDRARCGRPRGDDQDTSRIVSIGGAVTEILYALGLEKRIVAVDTTSLYPPRALHEKPNVGYMRQLSPEGVLGLGPSLILATEGAGPKETMAVLEAARFRSCSCPITFTGEGIVEKIALIAQATGAGRARRCLAERVQADLDALGELRARIAQPARVHVRALLRERTRDGRRPQHRGRRHHPLGRRASTPSPNTRATSRSTTRR